MDLLDIEDEIATIQDAIRGFVALAEGGATEAIGAMACIVSRQIDAVLLEPLAQARQSSKQDD